ncbi:MAG TPA: hypothetical protein VF772_04060, partial [Terriglobales bacterium]
PCSDKYEYAIATRLARIGESTEPRYLAAGVANPPQGIDRLARADWPRQAFRPLLCCSPQFIEYIEHIDDDPDPHDQERSPQSIASL